ncbi:hypothetical protein [Roseovarius sp.]|uniref:hypothetical protein n=1 Tax=Roseovarius sp. TaxID=1486281 RepID=UPI0035641E7D
MAIPQKTLPIEDLAGKHWDETKGSLDKTVMTLGDVALGTAHQVIEVKHEPN